VFIIGTDPLIEGIAPIDFWTACPLEEVKSVGGVKIVGVDCNDFDISLWIFLPSSLLLLSTISIYCYSGTYFGCITFIEVLEDFCKNEIDLKRAAWAAAPD